MKKVMVFGSFDVLHDGHRSLFSQAKQHGSELIVVVASDYIYEKLRGYRPIHNQIIRQKHVSEEEIVDLAVIGDRKDVYAVIARYRPHVIALGYDQRHFIDKLQEKIATFNLKSKIIRLGSHIPSKYKSSIIKQSLSQKGKIEL